jgi:hypothetical protein
MLWHAGQQRITRESRDRLAELFVTARDAGMDVLVSSGQATPKGRWKLPSYIRGEAPRARPVAPPKADREATLAKLAEMFPDAVRRAAS